jgi:hypothetical protein
VSGRIRLHERRVGVPGRAGRAAVVLGSVIAGVVALVLVLPVTGWNHDRFGDRQFVIHHR